MNSLVTTVQKGHLPIWLETLIVALVVGGSTEIGSFLSAGGVFTWGGFGAAVGSAAAASGFTSWRRSVATGSAPVTTAQETQLETLVTAVARVLEMIVPRLTAPMDAVIALLQSQQAAPAGQLGAVPPAPLPPLIPPVGTPVPDAPVSAADAADVPVIVDVPGPIVGDVAGQTINDTSVLIPAPQPATDAAGDVSAVSDAVRETLYRQRTDPAGHVYFVPVAA